MNTFKSLKNLILSAIFGIILFVASNNIYSAPRVEVVFGPTPIEVITTCPGPGFIWIRGHYRFGLWGRMVWVPGHWRRI